MTELIDRIERDGGTIEVLQDERGWSITASARMASVDLVKIAGKLKCTLIKCYERSIFSR